jgi:hypothetical protein
VQSLQCNNSLLKKAFVTVALANVAALLDLRADISIFAGVAILGDCVFFATLHDGRVGRYYLGIFLV